MADEKTPGSITQPADAKNERISEISNINRAISNMQKQIDQQLSEVDRDTVNAEAISSIQNSMNKVLNKMSETVGDVGKGFSSIAASMAKGAKDVYSDYHRALTQDINYNKQNIVAMALSKSSPIFGYYVSRFMETDVWKNAAMRMKNNIGNVLGSVSDKFRNAFRTITFRKKKDTTGVESVAKKSKEKIPHMAKGGIVKKEGLAKLHAAEVVMPVDKLLDRMDEQTSVTKTYMRSMARYQQSSLAKMDTYVGRLDKMEKVGLFKGFLKAMEEVQTQYEEPAEQRMLRALIAIQDALGAQVGTWTQVWQKMLVNHPTFRTSVFLAKRVADVISMPGKLVYKIFKARGGYPQHLSNSKQPFEAMNENLGVLYTGTMYRLDAVAMYTRATAEAVRHVSTALTGTKYKSLPGVSTGRWSIFGLTRKGINALAKGLIMLPRVPLSILGGIGKGGKARKAAIENFFGAAAEYMTKERLKRQVFQPAGLAIKKGQFEDIYGSEAEIKAGMSKKELEKYLPKNVVTMFMRHSAMPVYVVNSSGAVELQRKAVKIQEIESKKSKKILQLTDQNWRENKQANEREKRRTIFGFLGGGFRAVKGIFSSIAGFLPLLLGGGLKNLIFGGGLKKGIVSALKNAFLGKGASKASGGILKSLAKKLSGLRIKFPKGFMKRVFPALGNLARTIGSLAGSFAGKMLALFKSPVFLKVMGTGLAVAAAGVIGWKIGKKIDDMLGISKKLQSKFQEWDREGSKLAGEVGAKTQAASKRAREGGIEGYEAKSTVKLQASLAKFNKERSKDVGFFGRSNIVAIDAAQRKYMQENIKEYMKYSPGTLDRARRTWLLRGGYGGKWAGTDAANYGKDREAAFLKYLKSNKSYKPLTDKQAHAAYSKYQRSLGLTDDGGLMLEKPSLKESAIGVYKKVTDLAKNQVTEVALSTQALREEMARQGNQALAAGKESTRKLQEATNANTVIVSNTISQVSNTAMNGAQGMVNAARNQYNDALVTGEVDGD